MKTSKDQIVMLRNALKESQLDTFARFWDYSIDEMQAIYNGIGADWMPAASREKITQHAKIFEPATLEHDVYTYHLLCAATRENYPIKPFQLVHFNGQGNSRFYANCKLLVKAEYAVLNWRRYYYLWLAHKFFLVLEKFGILGIEASIKNIKKQRK